MIHYVTDKPWEEVKKGYYWADAKLWFDEIKYCKDIKLDYKKKYISSMSIRSPKVKYSSENIVI